MAYTIESLSYNPVSHNVSMFQTLIPNLDDTNIAAVPEEAKFQAFSHQSSADVIGCFFLCPDDVATNVRTVTYISELVATVVA